MCGKIDCFITAFSQLKVESDKKHWSAVTMHRAPHKPFLLLSILDLVSQRKITKEFVELTLELEETFSGYWQTIMPPGSSARMGNPFCLMDNEPFWTLVPRRGVVQPEEKVEYSMDRIREFYLGARLDKELFPLLLMEPLRRRLRETLIEKYFAPEAKPMLMEQISLNAVPDKETPGRTF